VTRVEQVARDDAGSVRSLAALRTAWAAEDAGIAARSGVAPATRIGEQVAGQFGEDSAEEFAEEFAAWFETQDRVFLLARDDDGDPVGMCNLRFFRRMPRPGALSSSWGYLANVYVLPAHRGAGTGGELVAAAAGCARAAGAVRLVTAPTERSRSLYRRHGFGAADALLVLPLS
jgi:GNAT superfamily N-acetyltransferase